MSKYDVIIDGRWGLYSIHPASKKGERWAQRKLSAGERTRIGEAIMCEGSDRCRDIVAAMDREGLKVELNGVDMKGYGGPRTRTTRHARSR
jgi:hypothetical protein